VPVLVDDGQVMFESCIINEYLEEKYPQPSLMPAASYSRACGRILIHYALDYLHPFYWPLREEMRKPVEQREDAAVTNSYSALRARLPYLVNALNGKEFFLESFGLVDIAL
jgi:glutathione S-transferase